MIWNEHTIAGEIARQTLARKCVVLVDNAPHEGPGAALSRTVTLDAVVGRQLSRIP